jgi:hypothetical protein
MRLATAIAFVIAVLAAAQPLQAELPVTVNLGFWVRADAGVNAGTPADGEPVTIWADQLTGDNDIADNLLPALNAPTFESGVGDTINGLPVIRFDDDILEAVSSPELNVATGFTFFLLLKHVSSIGNAWTMCKDYEAGPGGNLSYALGYIGNSYAQISFDLTSTPPDGSGYTPDGSWTDVVLSNPVLPAAGPHLLAGRYDALTGIGELEVWSSAGLLSETTGSVPPGSYVGSFNGDFSMGGYMDSYDLYEQFIGDIGEAAVYTVPINDADWALVREYFLDRWLQIFSDGFESGDTAAWSLTLP